MSSPKIAVLACLISFACISTFAARIEKHTLTSRGKERLYYLFVPDSADQEHRLPLLITLHGSGRNGLSLVEKWKALAAKSGVIVAGPDSTNTRYWSPPEDGPQLLQDLVEEIKKSYAIDDRRVYLFGHSAGAGFALQMALIESEYFAAVAVHAGLLQPEAYSLTRYASRKIPFAMFVGTNDSLFPLQAVRATRDHLQKAGFVAELTEIRNHTHDYYGRSASINKSAWGFLEQHSLAAEPKFRVYSIVQ